MSTQSYFELTFDLKCDATLVSCPNKYIQLVYSFNSTQPESETVKQVEEKDLLSIIYAINGRSIKFTRTVCIDLCKCVPFKCEMCFKSKEPLYKIYQVALKGEGRINNGRFGSDVDSLELARLAGDYFLTSQNRQTGGWLINVTRKFDKKSMIQINSSWHSAMAQAQAISLLCRLYSNTKNTSYLHSASNAMGLFNLDVDQNGVRTYFMNETFLWLEEYPTRPYSLFVLNGFIYSIFGIGDYLSFCNGKDAQAKELFLSSLDSLVALINFYDTGTRTFYDLRHLANAQINPNVARWDYHTLHVSQLYYLVSFLKHVEKNFDLHQTAKLEKYSKILKIIAIRWHNYAHGVWNQDSQIKYNS
jgi:heparosan-N-sulfate-glucuronate 5-epimerase